MGIYDRDYYREPTQRGGFALFRMWSVSTWLIIANVVVFIADNWTRPRGGMVGLVGVDPMGALERWGYFSANTAIRHLQIWRFLSFQFLHAGAGHLLGNMLGLYFFGPIVEGVLGRMRYLAFYLLCGVAGPLMYLVLWATGLLVTSPYVPMVGASAGVFGILMAAAFVAPDVQIMMWFPPIPMRLRTLAWVMMGLAVVVVFTQGANAGGEAAHLGGGLLGLAIMKNQHWLNPFVARRRAKKSRFWRPGQKDWSKDLDR